MPVDPTGIGPIVTVGKAAYEIVGRYTIKHAQMWWSGKEMIAVGPARAGKSTFLNYIQFNTLPRKRNGRDPETAPTVVVERRQSVLRTVTEDGNLVLREKRPIDIPGDLAPDKQIQYIERYKPHCVVVVLDATSPVEGDSSISSIAWLSEFCLHLEALLRRDNKAQRNLKSVTVLMNKWDKLSGEDEEAKRTTFRTAVEHVREVLMNKWDKLSGEDEEAKRNAFRTAVEHVREDCLESFRYVQGREGRIINIMESVLVNHPPYGQKYAQEILKTIAEDLEIQKSPQKLL